jgi:uncharacterized protein
MNGETDLNKLLKTMTPELNPGEFVFCTVNDLSAVDTKEIICFFREQEGFTVILSKELADSLALSYSFVASWITLTVHSSLEAVGLTAAFSKALTDHAISCNVIAGYFHDHIFVAKNDAQKAMKALREMSEVGSRKSDN